MTETTSDLTERYVWAVTHRLPAGQRDDVGAELRATIADMSEDRLAALSGDPMAMPISSGRAGSADSVTESVVGDVLVELGDPAVLASRYRGGARQLIGPDLFYDFRRTVTTLLAIVVPVTLIVAITVNLAIEDKSLGAGIGEGVVFTLQVAVQLAFWTVVAFALAERARSRTTSTGATNSTEPGQAWRPSQLPKLPAGRPIRLSGTIISAVVSLVILAWLLAQQFLSSFQTPDGDPIPVLDPALWSFWLPVLIVFLVADVAVSVISFRARRWTFPVMMINVVYNAVAVGFVVVMFTTQQVLDPRYVVAFRQSSPDLDPGVGVHFVLLIVVLIGVLDIVKAIRGYRQRG
ncbi:hypothetical protein FOE78_04415 [Microlunatus elymi]|uniref:Uncharacterized protein n=1 Tax=Microlunatus elymi TaxID=2596828 RepID=A0A516PVP1_9ACTN|nr:hypothetical protein [Microlunatus elymi]QDP95255.1 hypothetical protein FOE78_04415 [Microlunatus elymi]